MATIRKITTWSVPLLVSLLQRPYANNLSWWQNLPFSHYKAFPLLWMPLIWVSAKFKWWWLWLTLLLSSSSYSHVGDLCLFPQNVLVQGTNKSTQTNTPQILSQDSNVSSSLIWEQQNTERKLGKWCKKSSQKGALLSQLGMGQLELSHSGNPGEVHKIGNSDLSQLNVNTGWASWVCVHGTELAYKEML